MGGLLYKDFVATCKLKKINLVWILLGTTVLYSVLRIVFSGTALSDEFLFRNEQGETVNLMDPLFTMFFVILIINGSLMINMFIGKIIEGDEKNKIKGYLRVMPLGKHAYIASKYIYIGIVSYVLMSLEMIAASICKAYCLEGTMKTFPELLTTLIVGFAGLSLFLAAIEFPLFLSYGREKAMYGKIVLGTVIGLILIGYVLFGDVSVFENMDISKFVDWINEHQTEIVAFSTFSPILVLLIYYGSYQLSCKLVDRKETSYEKSSLN